MQQEFAMIVNVSFDSSVNPSNFDPTNPQQGAVEEAQFKEAIDYVVELYDNLFTNNVTINIDVGWGEIDRNPITNDSAESHGTTNYYSYADVLQHLTSDAQSYAQQTADKTLPTAAISPFGTGDSIRLSTAEAKAIGLTVTYPKSDPTHIDGWIGFNSSRPWSFDPTSTAGGDYDLVAAAEHEISEVMGRTSMDGLPNADNNPTWTPMDFFRYSSSGVRAQANDGTAYFSVDGGKTNLGTWNNVSSAGDLGDWVYGQGPVPGGYDAYGFDDGPDGKTGLLTTTDVTLMNVIGWNTNDLPVTSGGQEIVSEGVTDWVASGQSASNFLVEGGQQVVVSGGQAAGTVVSASGMQQIRNGGTARGAQIVMNGTQAVESSGVANDTVVENFGLQDVKSGGSSVDTLLGQNGFQDVQAGGIVINDAFDGGTQDVLSGAMVSGVTIVLGTQDIESGATATGTVVEAGSVQNVSAGGNTIDTSVVGGTQSVSGVALDTTTADNGTQIVWAGATVTGTAVVNGTERVAGTASGTVLDNAGLQQVYAGGTVVITDFGGGTQEILSGATVSAAVVGSGTQVVEGGGGAIDTVLDGGTQVISSTSITVSGLNHSSTVVIPGTAEDTTINSGGTQDIKAGGLAVGSVLDGGSGYVESGGTAYSTTISAGTLEVESGGAVNGGVAFTAGGNGTLRLDASADFLPDSVSIAGLARGDRLDLADIAFGPQTTVAFTEAANGTSGTLSVSDGTHTANLLLIGQYAAGNFGLTSDSHGGAMITEGLAHLHLQQVVAAPHG
jgi:autotransporter passenger strand-loop-strand repeat protein